MRSIAFILIFMMTTNVHGAFKIIKGTIAQDKLSGTDYDDKIYAFDGDDILTGYDGINFLYGDKGNDYYYHRPKLKAYDYIQGEDTCNVNVLICEFPREENVKCKKTKAANDLVISCEGSRNLKSMIRIDNYYEFETCNSRRSGWRISCQ